MRVLCRRLNLALLLVLLGSVTALASPAGTETFTVLIRQDGSYLAGNSYSGSFAWNVSVRATHLFNPAKPC